MTKRQHIDLQKLSNFANLLFVALNVIFFSAGITLDSGFTPGSSETPEQTKSL
jgi:hypothetical protein